MSFNAKAQFDKWLTSLALSTLFIARRVACPFACIRCSNHTQPRREALDESSFLPKNTTQKAQLSLESCPLDLESNPVLVIYKLFTLGFVSFSQQDSSALNAAWQSKQQLQEKRFFVCVHTDWSIPLVSCLTLTTFSTHLTTSTICLPLNPAAPVDAFAFFRSRTSSCLKSAQVLMKCNLLQTGIIK